MLDLRTFTKIAGPITLILLLGNSRESVAQLSPIQLQPYFKQDEFTACLAEEFAKNETPVKLRARLQEIDRQRTDLSSSTPHACKAVLKGMCQIIGISIADRVASYLEPVGCYMNDQIDKSLTNHSVALVKCPVPSIVQGVPFLSDLTEWEFLTRPAFPDLNQVSDLRGAVEQFAKAKVIRLSRPAADQKECVQNLAEPLAKWLLKNKFQSVSHWEEMTQI
jgi:hypothetical protein